MKLAVGVLAGLLSFVGMVQPAAVDLPVKGPLGVAKPDHVVIVVEENHSQKQIIGNPDAPYINALAKQGALFTNYYATNHPSEPNYLQMFSGSDQGLKDDSCPHAYSSPNLGSELISAGLSFAGYSESMPSDGFTGCWAGSYGRKHNPWVNFTNVPAASNKTFASFPSDFSKLPTVSFVIPNVDNDMHDGSVKSGDQWLKDHLGSYAEWAKDHNSLLIFTFDEDDNKEGNKIPTFFVGPMVKPGVYGEKESHLSLLRTVEDLYGLPYAGKSGTVEPIKEIWK